MSRSIVWICFVLAAVAAAASGHWKAASAQGRKVVNGAARTTLEDARRSLKNNDHAATKRALRQARATIRQPIPDDQRTAVAAEMIEWSLNTGSYGRVSETDGVVSERGVFGFLRPRSAIVGFSTRIKSHPPW